MNSPPPKRRTKDTTLRFRVTREEKRAILEAAARDGLQVSAWVRQLALRAAGVLKAN